MGLSVGLSGELGVLLRGWERYGRASPLLQRLRDTPHMGAAVSTKSPMFTGIIDQMYGLHGVQQDVEAAEQALVPLCASSDKATRATAKFFLSGCFELERTGRPVDQYAAYAMLRESYDDGCLDAAYCIAVKLIAGVGAPMDRNRAFEIVETRAYKEPYCARAGTLYGQCVWNGWGTEVNEKRARGIWSGYAHVFEPAKGLLEGTIDRTKAV